MDEFTHVFAGLVLALIVSQGDPSATFVFLAIFGSVLPDLIGEPLHWYVRYKNGKKFVFNYDEDESKESKKISGHPLHIVYDVFHSIFFVGLLFLLSLPNIFVWAYCLHIVLDIFSHSKNSWGLKLFYPLSSRRFGGTYDWWQWKLLRGKNQFYFNIICYIFLLLVYLFLLN